MKQVENSPFPGRRKSEPVLLWGIIFLLWCGSGCSRVPEEPSWFQSTSTGSVLSDNQLLGEISRTDSLFDLREMKREFILYRGGEPRIVLEELDRRFEEIMAEKPVLGSPSPEVDLVAFDYRKIGTGRYRADYLFQVNQPLRTDLRIALYGMVAPEHIDRISTARREEGKSSEVWSLQPELPTSAWREGDYRFLSQEFSAEAIPYNMMMVFYDPDRSPESTGSRFNSAGTGGLPRAVCWKTSVASIV